MHNFLIANADTDSISFCKSDYSPFSENEQMELINEINNLLPEKIKFSHDGYFNSFIVLKAKNYILYDGEKIKIKGSALKSSKTEIAFKEFLEEIISAIVYDKNNYIDIYNKYVREIMEIKDIKRWSSKKTITEKTQSSERTNESKVRDALVGSEYVQSDKIWVFFKSDDSLCLSENFNGDYNKEKLLKKLHSTSKIFANVLPTNDLFINYSLKKKKTLLEELLNVS